MAALPAGIFRPGNVASSAAFTELPNGVKRPRPYIARKGKNIECYNVIKETRLHTFLATRDRGTDAQFAATRGSKPCSAAISRKNSSRLFIFSQ